MRIALALLIALLFNGGLALGQELTVEEIVTKAKASIVAISVEGRGRGGNAKGSGFVIDPKGIIATNHHVLGQARPISVTFADGKEYEVTEVVAFDRNLDLALIRIQADEDLPALPLREEDSEFSQGSRVVAMGSPQGLDFSVVDGVVSGFRQIEGNELIQVAMPIERGNSGGPLLDREGRVVGVITLKSTLTDNIAFAMPTAALRRLIEKPNPIAMKNWVTIGTLDPERWEPLMGAAWTQRAGRIRVREMGAGFGGRSLCLRTEEKKETESYEISVEVKLDDEAGAAGIAFAGDGGDLHYGFYPTAGSLRLTRFDGPSVYTWTILEQIQTDAYRPGEFNHLRVRIEPKKIRCFVNGTEVITSTDHGLRGGRPGLCKFRQTEAEFAKFRVGKDLAPPTLDPALRKKLETRIAGMVSEKEDTAAIPADLLDELAKSPAASQAALLQEAEALAAGAERLRQLAGQMHREGVARDLTAEMTDPDQIDLAKATLLLARIDHPQLEVAPYLESIDRMATRVKEVAGKKPSQRKLLDALRTHLFDEQGFHGSRFDYYNPANSHLNEVIDDREGIPITLSVVFLEVGRRAGIKGLHGVGMPGHFIVSRSFGKDGAQIEYLDVFEGGEILGEADLELMAESVTGIPLREEHLKPSTDADILVRMLRNLVGVTIEQPDPTDALRYLDLVLAIDPDAHGDRLARAGIRYRSGDKIGSREDVEILIEAEPEGMNVPELRRLLEDL